MILTDLHPPFFSHVCCVVNLFWREGGSGFVELKNAVGDKTQYVYQADTANNDHRHRYSPHIMYQPFFDDNLLLTGRTLSMDYVYLTSPPASCRIHPLVTSIRSASQTVSLVKIFPPYFAPTILVDTPYDKTSINLRHASPVHPCCNSV